MLPTFKEHDWVKVELIPYNQIKNGDTVIRWHESGQLYIHHRVDGWEPSRGAWYTRGDNNPRRDRSLMYQSDFVGRTSRIEFKVQP